MTTLHQFIEEKKKEYSDKFDFRWKRDIAENEYIEIPSEIYDAVIMQRAVLDFLEYSLKSAATLAIEQTRIEEKLGDFPGETIGYLKAQKAQEILAQEFLKVEDTDIRG